jgi:MFS family permease
MSSISVFFGLQLMAGVPRTADLKENLGLSNGSFGTIVSCGAIGALISYLTMGTLVHKLGVRRSFHLFSIVMSIILIAWPHFHNPITFFICNLILAFAVSAFNTTVLTHGLARQKQTSQPLLGLIHGGWSIGVLITTLIALAVTSKVSFAWHIDSMAIFCFFGTQILLYSLRDTFTKNEEDVIPRISFTPKRIFNMLTFDKTLLVAFILGTMIEFSSGDWVNLLAHQEFKFNKSLSIVPYLTFMLMMIIGRNFLNTFTRIRSERFWLVTGSLVGSIGFLVFVHFAYALRGHASSTVVLSLLSLAFACAGFGTSYMAAILMSAGLRRNDLPDSTIMAQMNFSNVLLAFIVRIIFSWIAQQYSILIAFTIPALMLFAIFFLRYIAFPNVREKLA